MYRQEPQAGGSCLTAISAEEELILNLEQNCWTMFRFAQRRSRHGTSRWHNLFQPRVRFRDSGCAYLVSSELRLNEKCTGRKDNPQISSGIQSGRLRRTFRWRLVC